MPRTRCLLICAAVLALLNACRPADSSTELAVFAAASLTDAFDEISREFEAQHPGVMVIANYGGSSQLATQIREGAQADVYASANEAQMQAIAEAGHLDGDPALFVTNRLVLIVPADNPAGITTLADLAQPGVRLVVAVPGVPVRGYTDQVIAALAADPNYGAAYAGSVIANIASEEDNVRQIVAKVALGEADAGIVYASDVTPDVREDVKQIDIPAEVNVTAAYPIAVVAGSDHPDLAQAFIAFVLSDDGQAILAKWGFGPAPE